jgi:putative transcriptional regulator
VTSFGQSLIDSANEALAFARGEDNGCVVHIPDEIDTARIRDKLSMSQRQFADQFGIPLRTLQEYEQGRRVPSSPIQALIRVIDHEPEAVRRVLAAPTMSQRTKQKHKMLMLLFKRVMRANEVLTRYYLTSTVQPHKIEELSQW